MFLSNSVFTIQDYKINSVVTAQDKDRIFLIPVINARIPLLKNKMNWGERVFLAYQMKVLKHFSDKLFYLIIAEMPDFIVAN